MTNVLITGSPVLLTGQLESSLIIIDVAGVTKVYCPYPTESFTKDLRGFYFGYIHAFLNDANMTTIDMFLPAGDKYFRLDNTTTPAFALGKVYWLQSAFGATVQLTIPAMTMQTVIIP